ncbi:MAG: hypothetical protein KAJ03_10265 [Gammaproteobacteria bacterium]|nr:hypothetical protein [Gammaproteobacteria bacterium]
MTEGDFYNKPSNFDSRFPDRQRFFEKKKQTSRHTKDCNQTCQKHDELVHAIRLITAKEFDKKRLHRLIDEKIHNCGNTYGYCGRPEFNDARLSGLSATLCDTLDKFL